MRAVQQGLALRPAAPVLAEQPLLCLLAGAVERMLFREGQPEAALVVPLDPAGPDELAGRADRAEPLVVKVVRNAVAGHVGECGLCAGGGFIRQRPQHDLKAVGADVGRAERPLRLSQVFEREVRLLQVARRTALDRQVLHGDGVPILQPRIRDAVSWQLPAPENCIDCFGSPQPALGEPVQCEGAALRRGDVRQFGDAEVLRLALDLHRRDPCAEGARGSARSVAPWFSAGVRMTVQSLERSSELIKATTAVAVASSGHNAAIDGPQEV